MDYDLKKLFEPKSIAVIGASKEPTKIGHVILKNLVEGGFSGPVYPVNPSADVILYQHAFASILDIPSQVDLAIIVTPQPAVLKVLEECGKKGIKNAVIITSGFAEVGNVEAEEKIKEIAERYGIAVIGPNCISGDMQILVKSNGIIENRQIKDVIDPLLIKHKKEILNVSGTSVLDLVNEEEMFVASYDGSKVIFKKVLKVFKRLSSDNYEVNLIDGRKLVCSGDHPFITSEGQRVLCKDLKGTESGLCVRSIQNKDNVTQLNILRELVSKVDSGQIPFNEVIGFKLNFAGRSYKFTDDNMFVPYKTNSVKTDSVSWVNSKISMHNELDLSDELCELCGFFVADGNYDRDWLSIGYMDNADEHNILNSHVTTVFGGSERVGHDKIKFGRKIGKFVFQNLFEIPLYAEKKRVPNFIFSAKPDKVAAFLSGLFSGDGGIYSSDRRSYLYFYTTSKALASDVMYLLNLLGVKSYLSQLKRSESLFDGRKYSAQDLYTVRIESINSIKKLKKAGFRFFFNEQEKKLNHTVMHPSNTRGDSESVFEVAIKSVRKIEDQIELYDFEVEDTHNFIANGIVTSNCMGFLNTYTRVDSVFNPVYKLGRPKAGEIAFISQSGAVGAAVMDLAAKMGVGISLFVSYGNAAVVNETDMLQYLAEDPRTSVIAVYLEGVRDGRKFLEVAKNVTKRKPVILIKAGKTQAGSKAVASHTAALAGDYAVYSSAFKQAGILEVESLTDLFDYSKIFLQPFPNGSRTGIITNGGGIGVLTSDLVVSNGLQMADPGIETRKKLRDLMPMHVNIGNPLDLAGDADAARFKVAIDAMMEDKNVDIIILTPLMQTISLDSSIIDLIIKESQKMVKPIAVVTIGGTYTDQNRTLLENGGVPTYTSPYVATGALSKLARYAKHYQKE